MNDAPLKPFLLRQISGLQVETLDILRRVGVSAPWGATNREPRIREDAPNPIQAAFVDGKLWKLLPHMGVSKNMGKPPNHPILIGCSIRYKPSILGGFPLFLETSI